jgi:hypothetical protein
MLIFYFYNPLLRVFFIYFLFVLFMMVDSVTNLALMNNDSINKEFQIRRVYIYIFYTQNLNDKKYTEHSTFIIER